MDLYSDLKSKLYESKKDETIDTVMSALDNGTDVIELYKVFSKILNEWDCDYEKDPLCIWKEHKISSIVRTAIECSYPFIMKNKAPESTLTCAVFCPQEEEHELGARMVADVFTLNGIKTIFVGKEVPFNTFIEALKVEQFDMISISITDYYNLVYLCRFVDGLKRYSPKTKVLVGGRALYKNPEYYKKCGADFQINDFDELTKFLKSLGRSK
jgi:methanogenic corrinoid protein MtbC1